MPIFPKIKLPKNRNRLIIARQLVSPYWNYNNYLSYLLYLLFLIHFASNTCLVLLLVVDQKYNLGIFNYTGINLDNYLFLPYMVNRVAPIPTAFSTLLAYIIMRLSIDIREEPLPLVMKRVKVEEATKKNFIINSIALIIIALGVMFSTHIFVIKLISHFNFYNDMPMSVIVQLIACIALAYTQTITISGLLIIEKANKNFQGLMK